MFKFLDSHPIITNKEAVKKVLNGIDRSENAGIHTRKSTVSIDFENTTIAIMASKNMHTEKTISMGSRPSRAM